MLQCEHIYYKHDTIAIQVQKAHLFNQKWGNYKDIHPASATKHTTTSDTTSRHKVPANPSLTHPASFLGKASVDNPPSPLTISLNTTEKLSELCQYIFKHGDERTKTRALLVSVYHHSIHDRYYIARDLLLMSHIQDNIDKVESNTQILYNRTLVTLGLCAFRLGYISKAYDCLHGICSGRVKELLAQGISIYKQHSNIYDRDIEQEKIERRRQIPYHMHINPELLECCYLLCSMLLDLTYLAKPTATSSTHLSGWKPFRKYYNIYSKQQVFTGPPEYIRDYILLSTKYILNGEYNKAINIILNLDIWNLLPEEGRILTKNMLSQKIKEESIKVYILIYSVHYTSLKLEYIANIYNTDIYTIKCIISKMIYNKELSASIDSSNNTILLYNTDNTNLQVITSNLCDKIVLLTESNERLIDPIINAYNFNPKDEWNIGRNLGVGAGGGIGGGTGGGERSRRTGGGRGGYGGRSGVPGRGFVPGGGKRVSGGRGAGGGRGGSGAQRQQVWGTKKY